MRNVDYSLYLVTDRKMIGERNLLRCVEEAINGGVTIVQLREKEISSLEFYNTAIKLKELTTKYNIPLVINDRVDIALAVDADGVHVGQEDIPAKKIRELIGKNKILGVSVTNIEEAYRAVEDGADYIGVGAIFPTDTKKDATNLNIDVLKEIRNKVNCKVVAIGGINEKNINALKGLCDGVAVVSAILGKENIELAAKKLKVCFYKNKC
ncbi:thiamine phosphate synthase [Thermobrachium celere]|uniref:Thiamine-phosphate synthase n=1 Tax=Thermobrachium celere DSM 8682 TaxID=941824 RepID=R7RPY4_9CLOT|nr:thiamine phosphate synthase [Thermobrachium celere]CDF57421.1 Thiamin-phosphate pyrophosphorylase [Thermobrachium celere DSM 8682]